MDLLGQIQVLYHDEGLSMSEVAVKLGIKMGRVRSLMKWHKIPRRTQAESNRIKFLRSPLSYPKKEVLSLKDKRIYQAGIMLYWAEGYKAGKHTVDLANSDFKMIKVFLLMLRRIYRVDEKKIRIFLYCFANQNSDKLISYWSNLLKVPKNQFTKPYIRQDFDVSKSGKMVHGLVHIRYADTRLLLQIKQDIDIMYSRLVSS